MTDPKLSRRTLLARAGGAAAGAGTLALSGPIASKAASAPAVVAAEEVCLVFPDVVDGPYYLDKPILRQDITEGRKGIPLEMRVRVVDSACRPVGGARVDCWQADSGGIYSDFPNQGDDLTVATPGETFLRGTQTTDAAGWVKFISIYPGWYRGRTAHVHFKIYVGGKTRLTSQMFFPDALNEFIYTKVPGYTRALVRDTINVTDWIMAEATRNAVAQVKEELDRYIATLTYGVNPVAVPPPPEKMPCPPEPAKCVPGPGVPPEGADRITALVPSTEQLKRPKAGKPPLPPGWKPHD
jgi:protocatechuate 3,4-dioxygenase beta subunit